MSPRAFGSIRSCIESLKEKRASNDGGYTTILTTKEFDGLIEIAEAAQSFLDSPDRTMYHQDQPSEWYVRERRLRAALKGK